MARMGESGAGPAELCADLNLAVGSNEAFSCWSGGTGTRTKLPGVGKISHRAWFSPEEYKKLYEAARRRANSPKNPRYKGNRDSFTTEEEPPTEPEE